MLRDAGIEAGTIAAAVVIDLRDRGAIDTAVEQWMKHTGKARRFCVCFVADCEIAPMIFAKSIPGQPVECRAGGEHLLTIFATHQVRVGDVLAKVYEDRQTLRRTVAEIILLRSRIGDLTDMAVAIAGSRAISVKIPRRLAKGNA